MLASATRARPHSVGLPVLALLVGSIAIGSAPLLVRYADVGPAAIGFWRLLLALPVLWGLLAWQRPARTLWLPHGAGWWPVVVTGFIFAADLAIWHWAVHLTSVTNATLLAHCAPIFAALGGAWFFGEVLRRQFLFGLCVTLLGAGFLFAGRAHFSSENLLGDLLAFITAIFYASYILATKWSRQSLNTVAAMAWNSSFACIGLWLIAFLSGEHIMPHSNQGWFAAWGLALLTHVCGQSLFTFAVASLPAGFSALGLLLSPAVSMIGAWLLFHETFGGWQAIGIFIMFSGILLAKPSK